MCMSSGFNGNSNTQTFHPFIIRQEIETSEFSLSKFSNPRFRLSWGLRVAVKVFEFMQIAGKIRVP